MAEALKDSKTRWLGQIPTDWDMVKVKDCFDRKNKKANQKDPVVLSLARSGVKIRDITSNEGQLAADYTNYNPVAKDDILINPMDLVSGDNCNISKVEGVISPAYVNLRYKKGINPRFYNYYFKLQYWLGAFFAHGFGVSFDNRWTLSYETLSKYPLVLPPSGEQNKIADFLDEKCAEIDKLSEDIQKQIDILEEYKKSVITRAVTKGIRNNVDFKPSNCKYVETIPEYASMTRMKYITKLITDGTHQTPDYQNNGVPFLSIKDVSSGFIDFNDIKYISEREHKQIYSHAPVKKGDILFTRIGTLGVSIVVDTEEEFSIFVSLGLIKPRVDLVLPKYLSYVMNSGYFYDYIQEVKAGSGTHAAKFNLGDVSESPIVLYPLKEQADIVDFLDAKCQEIEESISFKKEQLTKLAVYEKSIIYEYVTGKKRIA